MRRPYGVFLRYLTSQLRDCIVPTTYLEFELDARAGYYTSQLIEYGEKLDGQ